MTAEEWFDCLSDIDEDDPYLDCLDLPEPQSSDYLDQAVPGDARVDNAIALPGNTTLHQASEYGTTGPHGIVNVPISARDGFSDISTSPPQRKSYDRSSKRKTRKLISASRPAEKHSKSAALVSAPPQSPPSASISSTAGLSSAGSESDGGSSMSEPSTDRYLSLANAPKPAGNISKQNRFDAPRNMIGPDPGAPSFIRYQHVLADCHTELYNNAIQYIDKMCGFTEYPSYFHSRLNMVASVGSFEGNDADVIEMAGPPSLPMSSGATETSPLGSGSGSPYACCDDMAPIDIQGCTRDAVCPDLPSLGRPLGAPGPAFPLELCRTVQGGNLGEGSFGVVKKSTTPQGEHQMAVKASLPQAHIEREEYLHPLVIAKAVRSAAKGLNATHARNLAHGDIKASNLLVPTAWRAEDGPQAFPDTLWLCDFELASPIPAKKGAKSAIPDTIGMRANAAPELFCPKKRFGRTKKSGCQ
ncbi:hypothetical protein WJX73_005577 [Symbiochloris irregularis]|uniref:Protein kinase domain-containing protein n=1 Tax=Symbiochloris irregularis TaxID=706552 RepID=A0AAW1P2P3_9CHLO